MVRITPCRDTICDRFPVASFFIDVPRGRYYEVACATDPLLFASGHAARRTPDNFATSRTGGLLRASDGRATYLVPAAQLRRFTGARQLYFALAAFASPRGAEPTSTWSPDRPSLAPSIRITPDFTGRTLAAGPSLGARYGDPGPRLTWGGDALAPTRARRWGDGADAIGPTGRWFLPPGVAPRLADTSMPGDEARTV